MKALSIQPTTLTIISTYKCTSSCADCCFACNPNRQEKLSVDDVIKYISNVLACYSSIKIVVVTGGECFLLGKGLNRIVRYVRTIGLFCRVETNGFWAYSKDVAYKILSELKEDGLTEINFSTGDDHQKYVPLQRIFYGIEVALELGLNVALNIETGNGRHFTLNSLLDSEKFKKFLSPYIYQKPLVVVQGQWMPFTQESLSIMLNDKNIMSAANQGRCVNLFTSVTLSPTKHLFACCGLPAISINFFDLGFVNVQDDIRAAYECQFDDFLKIWLFTEGPYRILSFIANKIGKIPELEYNFHMCFLCASIFCNEKYLNVLQEHYKEVYSSILLKYFLLKKQLNHVYSK